MVGIENQAPIDVRDEFEKLKKDNINIVTKAFEGKIHPENQGDFKVLLKHLPLNLSEDHQANLNKAFENAIEAKIQQEFRNIDAIEPNPMEAFHELNKKFDDPNELIEAYQSIMQIFETSDGSHGQRIIQEAQIKNNQEQEKEVRAGVKKFGRELRQAQEDQRRKQEAAKNNIAANTTDTQRERSKLDMNIGPALDEAYGTSNTVKN